MRTLYALWLLCGCWLGLLSALNVVRAEDVEKEQAVKQVEAAPCKGGTVGARLQEEITAHSRRDLGWQVFATDGANDIERVLRVSKSMDLRYRWRLTASGGAEAQSEAAKRLCE